MTELERAAVEYVEATHRADFIRNRIGFRTPMPADADAHIAAIETCVTARKRLEEAVRAHLATPPHDDSEFEVVVTPTGDRDPFVAATVSGPHDQAHREALGYAEKYRCEGSVTVNEVTREVVAKMTATNEDAT